MKLQKGLFAWVAMAFICTPVLAAISIVEPGNEKIAEGVEFSAYVIGNRWDMSDQADVITTDPSFLSNESFSNGIYTATSVEVDGVTDPKFFLTYPGLSSAISSMESGQKFPIDTSVYRTLSIKIRHLDMHGSPTNSRHTVQVFFFEDEHSIRDRTFGYASGKSVMSDGDWHIVQIDMIDDLSPNSRHSWTDFSSVKGLRIDPTFTANTRIEIDWVRLTAPADASAQFNVQWSGGSGPYSVSAREHNNISAIMATDVHENSLNVDFSTLPAGDYFIEVSNRQEKASSKTTLRINEAPVFNFLQPDIRGDVAKRYSLMETGNSWGPIDAADVASTNQLTNISYANPSGSLVATTVGSDSQVLFNTPKPIDALKYRMLTYTISVSGPSEIGLGSVARLFWRQAHDQMNTSEDIVVKEGLNTYELGDLQNLRVEDGPADQWLGSVVRFRLDPTEFSTPKNIRIDNVILAPFDAAEPTFEITWLDSNEDDDAVIQLYADRDEIVGNGNEILIAGGLKEDDNSDSFVWTATEALEAGVYYLYANIDDGLNHTTRYATGPIKVSPQAAPDPGIIFKGGFEY